MIPIGAGYTGKNAGKKTMYVFVGLESNAKTAELMFGWAIKSVMKEQRKGSWNESFCIGAGTRIQNRCFDISQARKPISEGRGLMVVDLHDREREENGKFLEDKGIVLTEQKKRKLNIDVHSYSAGRQYGDSIKLNTQLEN